MRALQKLLDFRLMLGGLIAVTVLGACLFAPGSPPPMIPMRRICCPS